MRAVAQDVDLDVVLHPVLNGRCWGCWAVLDLDLRSRLDFRFRAGACRAGSGRGNGCGAFSYLIDLGRRKQRVAVLARVLLLLSGLGNDIGGLPGVPMTRGCPLLSGGSHLDLSAQLLRLQILLRLLWCHLGHYCRLVVLEDGRYILLRRRLLLLDILENAADFLQRGDARIRDSLEQGQRFGSRALLC